MMKNNSAEPHSPDVFEREISDGGFSKGWGMHYIPMEEYWVDAHTHIQLDHEKNTLECMEKSIQKLSLLNVNYMISCTPIMITKEEMQNGHSFLLKCLCGIDMLRPYINAAKESKKFSLLLYMSHTNPDTILLSEAIRLGVKGIKLHNAPIIYDNLDPELWLSDKWSEIFEIAEKLKLPILWHVTQRLTDAPYAGVGRNSYWKDGWKKGVEFSNEDLLQVFLKIVEKYPKIKFVGAHQLHIGWERLSQLFDRFDNLYTDTSVGCVLKEDFLMHDYDREYIRNFFIKYSNRIMYGTDLFVTDTASMFFSNTADALSNFSKPHINFIRKLVLPHEELQKISHENAELLYKGDVCK